MVDCFLYPTQQVAVKLTTVATIPKTP